MPPSHSVYPAAAANIWANVAVTVAMCNDNRGSGGRKAGQISCRLSVPRSPVLRGVEPGGTRSWRLSVAAAPCPDGARGRYRTTSASCHEALKTTAGGTPPNRISGKRRIPMSHHQGSVPYEIGAPLKQAFVEELDEEPDAAHAAQVAVHQDPCRAALVEVASRHPLQLGKDALHPGRQKGHACPGAGEV